MTDRYDSAEDTKEHIGRVRFYLAMVMEHLGNRADNHDSSKLRSPEKDAFDVLTPRLKGLTYGSEEYRATLREMKPALEHHYAHNSHHPEHYPDGIAGMSLLDLVEMVVDWKAASERHADGDYAESLRINRTRFAVDDQLYAVLWNTARELGLVSKEVAP